MLLFSAIVHLIVLSKMCGSSSLINLTQRSGKIETPGYPLIYGNNLHLTWTINSSTPMRFLLTMVFFDIENSVGCKNDRLEVRVHPGSPGCILPPVVCGRMNGFPTTWNTVSYGVQIDFKSDTSVTNRGFNMEYETQDVESNELCNLMRKGDSFCGTIYSEYLGDRARYPVNLNCSWEITSNVSRELHVQISKFNLEYFGESCEQDHLSIYTSSDEENNHLGTFCGRRDPWEILVNGSNSILLRLITDEGDNLGGFRIEYFSAVSKADEIFSDSAQLRIKGRQKGMLHVPIAWTHLREQKAVLRWQLQADHGFTIRLSGRFRSPNRSGVFVTVYDAPTDSYDDDKKEYHLTSGDSFSKQSSGFHLVVKAIFNLTSEMKHLNMTYSTANYLLSNDIHIRYLNKGDYTFANRPKVTFKCCVYHQLVTLPDKTIAFNLKENGVFGALPNDGNCSTAGVVVFDGGFAPSQTIGPVCDTIPNRVYETFHNFVSMSSTIFVFVYGYSNTPALMNSQYKLEAWPTACAAKHVTRAFLSLPTSHFPMEGSDDSNLTSISIETSHTKVQSQAILVPVKIRISSVYDPEGCFLVFVHPLENSEPPIEITDECQNITATLCQKWPIKTEPYEKSEETLPVAWSKFSQQWSCSVSENSTDVEGTVYRTEGNANATWSQRLVLFRRGDVDTHLCGEAPRCVDKNKPQMLLSPCGIISHSGPECTWILHDSSDVRPHYWIVHILSVSPTQNENCSITTEELIRDGETPIKTRFSCSDLVSNRQISYQTMELYSSLVISNTHTNALKIRFSKTFVSPFILGEEHLTGTNKSCPENSTYFESFCYAFHRQKGNLTWTYAEEACKMKNGHLVSITRRQELDFLKRQLGSHWSYDLFQPPFGYIFVGLSDLNRSGVYRWQDGNPLSVADWYHPWDLNHNILPFHPALPLTRQQSQPVADKNKRCVAMAVGNVHFSTNWAKIPCLRPYENPSYICKWPAIQENTTGDSKPASNSDILREDLTTAFSNIHRLNKANEDSMTNELLVCPKQWTYIGEQCYSLLSEDIPLDANLPVWKARQLCDQMGGELALAEILLPETLLYHLELWGIGQGDGNIWVRTKDEKPGCTSFSTLLQGRVALPSEKAASNCALDEGRTQFVLCETNPDVLNMTCQEHQFMCQDGTCLPDIRVCDGQPDCLDGSDEELCREHQDDFFFACEDGNVISISDVCDFWPDCSDESDEIGCQHRACGPQEFSCGNQQCIPIEQKCDFVANCRDASDEDRCDWGVDSCKGFACPDATCLPLSRVTDLVADCPDGSEADEYSGDHLRLTFPEHSEESGIDHVNNKAWCPGTMLYRRCHRDRVTCFHRANVCVYDQNEHGDILHCRDGIHLENCEDYKCSNHFKCPKSYCIPWHKVCDGQVDCIDGADESKCHLTSCPGRLRCKDSHQCITREQMCDGRFHCRGSWTDERFCDLLRWTCPQGCRCQGYGVDCNQGGVTSIPDNLPANTRVLQLDRNDVQLTISSFNKTPYLLVLRLARNNISYVPMGSFSNLLNLRILDLRFNVIKSLYADMFHGLISLRSLLLQGNPLRILPPRSFMGLNTVNLLNLSGLGINRIDRGAFVGLQSLEHLDISNNDLAVLEPGFVPPSINLISISLTGNGLDDTPAETFAKIVAKKVWTDSFKFCCLVNPNSVDECVPNADVVSSCKDLLSTVILRSFVWFLGVACTIGNIIVFIWRIRSGCDSRSSVYVIHLATSDALMGLYLIILASTDTFYRGNYILHDTEWRRGAGCQFLGVLTTVSCQMSMFTLFALAWDRYFAVMSPLSYQLRSTRHVWMISGGLWCVSFLIALVPVVVPSLKEFYGKNALCMPFIFTDSKSAGWEYATAIFVGLNGLCIVIMIALYGAIYCRVRESQMDMGRNDRSDLVVAKRLSLVLLTNIISWIPLIMANVISLATVPLTRDMATMLTGVLLPLNPAINPYLYTFSSCVRRNSGNFKTT